MTDEATGTAGEQPDHGRPAGAPGPPTISGRRTFIGFVIVLALTDVLYRIVYGSGEQQTAALYVGVPALLAIGLSYLPRSQSVTGGILKGSTIALVLGAVILPEGAICLAMALPLVLLIGIVVGLPLDFVRRRGQREGPARMAVAIPLVLLSMEGLIGSPVSPHARAAASITVEATPSQVAAALATTPTFDGKLPIFLAIGFNRPVSAAGSGIDVGDTRDIVLTGGNHDDHPLRLFGITGHASMHDQAHMAMTVTGSSPGRVVFRIDHDGTMLARWLTMHRAVITWHAIAGGRTKVTWAFDYDRLLSPSMYFGPMEQYAMGKGADYLLHTLVADQLR